MHPVMFRIPLPDPLPLGWIAFGVGCLLIALAAWQGLVKKNRSAAGGYAVAGAVGIAARFILESQGVGSLAGVGPVPIYSYGLALGLSLVVGWYLSLGLADRDGLPREVMANNYVVTAVSALLGARLLYILTNLGEFTSFGTLFSFSTGGLVAYGGFVGGFLGSWGYLRYKRMRALMAWADVAVPGLASGLIITRTGGCYMYGCDYGKLLPTGAPEWLKSLGTFPRWEEGTLPSGGYGSPAWADHVSGTEPLLSRTAIESLPVHPTQLYEALVGAALLALVLLARRKRVFRGQIFFIFTFGYAACRFLLEIVRADPERGTVPPSLPQHLLIPACLALFGLGYALAFSRMIDREWLRRLTQVLAFVPAVLLWWLLKPGPFGRVATEPLSTSQFIGLLTAAAVSVAFVVFYRNALANPVAAMALRLAPDEPSEAEEPDEPAEPKPARRRRKRPRRPSEAKGGKDEAAAAARRKRRRQRRAEAPRAEGEDE